ncbi:hypothetical protein [Ruegeria meonggei]|uniref:Uncharacterized protein n=1 Tax=Ruegeria meonggei TaxID=1446476 RepID=A0A1X6ZS05_9RHOB|nr:hypothetical protein [Ruegeria meonggei]SLN59478.1 hypothetical protein RUM8411_02922 [Ruegeria meonggei]
MHKKFIALIVATAVAVTGVSASQARAADAGDILGGLAAIALIGAAVKHFSDENKKNTVTHNYNHVYQPPKHHAHPKPAIRPHHVRPLPKHIAKYDLPQRCLRTFKAYSHKRPLLGAGCLNKHYKYSKSLPNQCKVKFWNGKKSRRAYHPGCLRQKGYRVSYR